MEPIINGQRIIEGHLHRGGVLNDGNMNQMQEMAERIKAAAQAAKNQDRVMTQSGCELESRPWRRGESGG